MAEAGRDRTGDRPVPLRTERRCCYGDLPVAYPLTPFLFLYISDRSVMYSSQQFVEQLPVQDGEQCRELESHTTNVLINPDTTTNWKDWTFKRKRVCEEFPMTQALKSKKSRSKFSLNCAEQRISYSETNSTDVFTVNFRDSCLGSFIQRCCTDDNPVPNVVHLVWFGKNELKFFNFLTLMSVLR